MLNVNAGNLRGLRKRDISKKKTKFRLTHSDEYRILLFHSSRAHSLWKSMAWTSSKSKLRIPNFIEYFILQSIVAATIFVALLSAFSKFRQLIDLWRVSKIDFVRVKLWTERISTSKNTQSLLKLNPKVIRSRNSLFILTRLSNTLEVMTYFCS